MILEQNKQSESLFISKSNQRTVRPKGAGAKLHKVFFLQKMRCGFASAEVSGERSRFAQFFAGRVFCKSFICLKIKAQEKLLK